MSRFEYFIRIFTILLAITYAFMARDHQLDCCKDFMELGKEDEDLRNTKWAHSDCGKVVFTDRVVTQRENKAASVDYFVTYRSGVHNKDITLKVTPGAYKTAQDAERICFLTKDPSTMTKINTLEGLYFVIFGLAFYSICQFIYVWNSRLKKH